MLPTILEFIIFATATHFVALPSGSYVPYTCFGLNHQHHMLLDVQTRSKNQVPTSHLQQIRNNLCPRIEEKA